MSKVCRQNEAPRPNGRDFSRFGIPESESRFEDHPIHVFTERGLLSRDNMDFKAGQSALEYLLLLGVMVVIALTAFRVMLPDAFIRTNGHFSNASTQIIGHLPKTYRGGPFP